MYKHFFFLCYISAALNAYQWLAPAWLNTHSPSRQIIRKISDSYYKKYEPYNNNSSKQCLFFTGGNTEIPSEIYTSFLTKLSEQNLVVNIVTPSLVKNNVLLKTITNNEPTTIIGHSSGSATAISCCKYLDNVDKIVLLDPVDNRMLISGETPGEVYFFEGTSINKTLIVNAEKSYQWKWFPFPKIPFIPFFGLGKDKFNVKQMDKVNVREYGHSDILDYPWGKLMHNTLSEGVDNRNEILIDEYHQWLAILIGNYIHSDTIIRDDTIIHYID